MGKGYVTFEEDMASLPPDERREVEELSAKLIAEYQAEIDADRAAGIVPPEDLPVDESIFSNEVKPQRKKRAVGGKKDSKFRPFREFIGELPPDRQRKIKAETDRSVAKYEAVRSLLGLPMRLAGWFSKSLAG